MAPISTKESSSFTFSNSLPSSTKEDTFSNTLPSSTKEDTFSNTLPTDPKEDPTSNPCMPSEQRITRRNLFSHIASIIFAIPTLILLALDLHAYHSRPPTTVPVQQGQYSIVNPILILDNLSLALLALTILYGATFLSFRRQITPAAIRAYATPLFFLDALLCVGMQAASDTIIGMRSGVGQTGCERFTWLDPNACDSGRRTIVRAGGAMGILTR